MTTSAPTLPATCLTENGNFSHITFDGVKTACGREISDVRPVDDRYIGCHRCTKYEPFAWRKARGAVR